MWEYYTIWSDLYAIFLAFIIRKWNSLQKICKKKSEKKTQFYLIFEILFQFCDGLAPVSSSLLADELDVQKCTLAWAEHVT